MERPDGISHCSFSNEPFKLDSLTFLRISLASYANKKVGVGCKRNSSEVFDGDMDAKNAKGRIRVMSENQLCSCWAS